MKATQLLPLSKINLLLFEDKLPNYCQYMRHMHTEYGKTPFFFLFSSFYLTEATANIIELRTSQIFEFINRVEFTRPANQPRRRLMTFNYKPMVKINLNKVLNNDPNFFIKFKKH